MSALRLYPAESSAKPARVCVTGATGFVASSIVQRLLLAGHHVHGTTRDVSNKELVDPLLALPGAKDRLKMFAADLMKPGSFDDAIAGCDYVIHCASPFIVSVKTADVKRRLVDPAVKGTENVLATVEKTASVKRVVLTSSTAAITGKVTEHGEGNVITENDWANTVSETYLPYYYSKKLAEQRAWELVKQQSRYDLVTIHPGFVVGPPVGTRRDSESVVYMTRMLKGEFWPAVPPFYLPYISLEDASAAHVLALITPSAKGRYVVTVGYQTFTEWARMMLPEYKKYRIGSVNLPYFLAKIVGPIMGVGRDFIDASYSTWRPQIDGSRVVRELGLEYSDIRKASHAMAERVLDLGLVKRK